MNFKTIKCCTLGFMLLALAGCSIFDDDTYYESNFIIENNCDVNIEIYSSAIVYSQINGRQEVSFHDVVESGNTVKLRSIDATENVNINDVFTALEVYNSNKKITIDIMEIDNWQSTKNTDETFTYTLNVKNGNF